MRYAQFGEAAGPKDPNKMLAIRLWGDSTTPIREVAKLGKLSLNNPQDTAKLADIWYRSLEHALSDNGMLDVTQRPEFKGAMNWLTNRYISGELNYEDMTSRAVDAVAFWLRLKYQPDIEKINRGLYPSDANSFRSVDHMISFISQAKFREFGKKFKDLVAISKAKRGAEEIVLQNDDKFKISIPLNYAACYVFNVEDGARANYCTGSSSGRENFPYYAGRGILINVLDKTVGNDPNGKWQIHAPSGQFYNAWQQPARINKRYYSGPTYFKIVYPGLMQHIVDLINAQTDNIKNQTGFDAASQVTQLKRAFPAAFQIPKSGEEEPEELIRPAQ